MDKFSSISLFDFFSFVIPGVILEVVLYFIYKLSGCILLFNFPLLHSNEVVLLLLLTTGGYLLGHFIHFIGNKISWLGTSLFRKKDDGLNFLKSQNMLRNALVEKCRESFGFSIADKEGRLLRKETNDLFNISFRMLEDENRLQTVRTLQTQFILFSNLFTVGIISLVLFTGFFILSIIKTVPVQSWGFMITVLIITVISSIVSYAIAAQRRKLFIHQAWWQIYTLFYQKQFMTPPNEPKS